MFCTKCGNKLADDARFCTKCGTAVNTPSVPSTPHPAGTFGNIMPVQMKAPLQQQVIPRKKLPLKPFIIAGASLIVIAVVLMSILVFRDDVDVYACGRDEDDNPAYWKNGKLVELPSMSYDDGCANSMYVSGNDVYVCGWVGDVYNWNVAYWKNGKLVELHDNGEADSIYISSNDVYICGRLFVSDYYKPAYWKNGKIEELPPGYTGFSNSLNIHVSGNDVYVSGIIGRFFESTVVYWKNGKPVELPDDGALFSASADSIYVSGNDVYVCGRISNYDNHNAVYWKNGKLVKLPGDDSYASSIYVSGNDVYTCGMVGKKAVYWKNGKLIELPGDVYNVNLIYVSGSNVYVVGDYNDPNDLSIIYIVLWKNDKVVRSYKVGNIENVFLKKK